MLRKTWDGQSLEFEGFAPDWAIPKAALTVADVLASGTCMAGVAQWVFIHHGKICVDSWTYRGNQFIAKASGLCGSWDGKAYGEMDAFFGGIGQKFWLGGRDGCLRPDGSGCSEGYGYMLGNGLGFGAEIPEDDGYEWCVECSDDDWGRDDELGGSSGCYGCTQHIGDFL